MGPGLQRIRPFCTCFSLFCFESSLRNASQSYAQCYQLPVRTFRLTNLYGPWQLPDRIIPRNLGRMLDGLPLDIQGSAVRDFLYIDDALRAIEQIMIRGQDGQTYNISTGIGTTMQEIGMLLEPLDRSATAKEIRELEPTQSRGSSLVVHSGKLRASFGWYPQITLEQGLEKHSIGTSSMWIGSGYLIASIVQRVRIAALSLIWQDIRYQRFKAQKARKGGYSTPSLAFCAHVFKIEFIWFRINPTNRTSNCDGQAGLSISVFMQARYMKYGELANLIYYS